MSDQPSPAREQLMLPRPGGQSRGGSLVVVPAAPSEEGSDPTEKLGPEQRGPAGLKGLGAPFQDSGSAPSSRACPALWTRPCRVFC